MSDNDSLSGSATTGCATSDDCNLINRIVDECYQAALDRGLWPPLWADLAHLLQADSGGVFLTRSGKLTFREAPDEIVEVFSLPGWPERVSKLFLERYHEVDTFTNYLSRHHTTGIVVDREVISIADYEHSEIWNDLGRPYMPAYHFLVAGVPVIDSIHAYVSFHRPPDAAPFDEADRMQLDQVMPHVRRALQLGQCIAVERAKAAMMAAVLDSANLAVVVVAADGRVLLATAAAEGAVAGGGLVLGRHRVGLRAEDRNDNRRLRALIADAAAGRAGGALLISRPHGGMPLWVLVSQMPEKATNTLPSWQMDRPAAMITIRTASDDLGDAVVRMAAAFRLTAAESDVLTGLLAGRAVKQIAGNRGVSPLTVRAQIRQLLAKCEVPNLRELVRFAAHLG